jgi:YVTN family beta-propeller protein
VTNQVYVANYGGTTVTVIDGATNGTATVTVGSVPNAVAVNAVTNKVYVANDSSNSVTVIDGATNGTTTVTVGSNPRAVAVNPVTNKVYVANYGDSTVTEIDGATNGTTTVTVGTNPWAVAVNPVTNKVYVSNYGGGTVTVIDGATNGTTPLTVGTQPYAVAVNPVTNHVYVANYGGTTVTVIDGATNGTTNVTVGSSPFAVAVNPVTNKVYVANNAGNTVTVIDGATNGTTTVTVGSEPWAVAVNPVTNKVYVSNYGGTTVTVINVDGSQSVPLTATSAIAPGDPLTVSATAPYITYNIAPAFTATVTSAYSTSSVYTGYTGTLTNPPPTALYYWVDDGSGSSSSATAWSAATESTSGNPATFTLSLSGQRTGLHTLYYYAAYGDDGTPESSGNGTGNSPGISNLQQIVYEVLPATSSTAVAPDVNPQNSGGSVTFTATVTPGTERGSVAPTGSVYFYDGSTLLGSTAVALSGGSYTAAYATTTLTAGSHTITALYGGDSNYASSSGTATENIAGTAAAISVVSGSGQSSTVGTAFSSSLVVLVTDASTPAIPVPGATVTFASAGMSFSSSGVAATGSNGQASITATPTSVGTTLSATATVTGVSTPASFTESASIVTPMVSVWPTASAINYGQTLASSTLTGGTASVAGSFAFTTPTTAPGAGTASQSVTFTPNDTTDYSTVTGTASVTVNLATQAISFTAPTSPVAYGVSPISLSATGGSSGNAVTFSIVSGPGSISGSTLTITGAGTVVVAANQAGNANYAAAAAVQRSIVVNQVTSTLSGPAQPVPVTFGTAGSILVTVTGQYTGTGIAAPSGPINYTIVNSTNSTVASGSLPLTAGSANSTASIPVANTLAAGLYSVTVNYAGNTNYTAATGITIQLQVGQQSQSITFNPLSAVTYGVAPITLSATATSGLTVTFSVLSGPGLISGSTLTVTGAGTIVIAANQTGNSVWKAATQVTQTLTVTQAPPRIVMTSNSNPVLVQNSITLTATVSSSISTPTGTVSFLDGATAIGTGTVNSSGVATYSTAALAVGTHSITAVYSGDTNFLTVTSSATSEVVQDFNLTLSITGGSAGATTVTAQPGGTAVYTFTLSPVGSTTFPATVTLSASGLPAGATYTISPATLAAGAGSTTITLTIQLPQTAALNAQPGVRHAAEPAVMTRNNSSSKLPYLALAVLLLPFAGRMRRTGRKLGRLLPLLLIAGLAATAGLSGCASLSAGYFGQAPTTYTISVTATSGTLTHSTSVTLIVQ